MKKEKERTCKYCKKIWSWWDPPKRNPDRRIYCSEDCRMAYNSRKYRGKK